MQMTGKQIEEALFAQFEQQVLDQRASAARLKERQRLDEVEYGNEEVNA